MIESLKDVSNVKSEDINAMIRLHRVDTNKISDGYHTFGELYLHRIELYIALCKECWRGFSGHQIWRSVLHSDLSEFEGWFLLGIDYENGKQITYHLPMDYWKECEFATTRVMAPEFDGHTSADVLERLKQL